MAGDRRQPGRSETPPEGEAGSVGGPQVVDAAARERSSPRALEEITPPLIFAELAKSVLGQEGALRRAAVAIHKHTTHGASGNMLLIGSSGTGKTTLMNAVRRLYEAVPAYRGFRVMTILNANLLVDGERAEFRAERLLGVVERQARATLDPRPSPAQLAEAMERATVCIDEIDKMTTLVMGRAQPIGAVMQQGLLTMMEGERVPHRTRAWVDGAEAPTTLEIDTGRMMFICGGAFEGLYDQVRERVARGGEQAKLPTETVVTADGHVRIFEKFNLSQFLKLEDLFIFGMVPQLVSRFDQLVLFDDLSIPVLERILLEARDSPFVRSRDYLASRGIRLELEDRAARMIAERAAREPRSGARALRDLFARVVTPYEFDPRPEELRPAADGGRVLVIEADTVRAALR